MENCGQVKKILNNREKRKLTSSGNGLISSSRSRATRATSPRAAASRNFSAIPATHLQKKRKWTIIRGIRFKLHPIFHATSADDHVRYAAAPGFLSRNEIVESENDHGFSPLPIESIRIAIYYPYKRVTERRKWLLLLLLSFIQRV